VSVSKCKILREVYPEPGRRTQNDIGALLVIVTQPGGELAWLLGGPARRYYQIRIATQRERI
jgi:hypothetical protein